MEPFLLEDLLLPILLGLYALMSSSILYGLMANPRDVLTRIRRFGISLLIDRRQGVVIHDEHRTQTEEGGQQNSDEADSGAEAKRGDRTHFLFGMTGAALVAFSLFLGHFTESISNFLVQVSEDIRIPIFVYEKQNRSAVLFNQTEITPLGMKLVELNAFAALGGEHGPYAQEVLRSGDTREANHENLDDAASEVYYHAKNIVFDRDTYYKELDHLQSGIDFVRSLTAITALQTMIAFSVLLLGFLRNLKVQMRAGFAQGWHRVFIVAGIGVLYSFGHFTFKTLEQDFNKRAFGYYATAVKQGLLDSISACSWRPPTESFSGMTRIRESNVTDARSKTIRYLVAHDRKRSQKGARLGIVQVQDGRALYAPILLMMPPNSPAPSDLESLCAIPGKHLEFLCAESGHYNPTKLGRLLHFRLSERGSSPPVAEVLASYPLPQELGVRDPDNDRVLWKQVEGIVCIQNSDGSLRVILGERTRGDLLVCSLIEGKLQLEREIEGLGPPKEFNRAIAELHYDTTRRTIVAVATSELEEDDEDKKRDSLGPLASSVYTLAAWDPDLKMKPEQERKELWRIDGFKVEAFATTSLAERPYCFGTDDEHLGGCWRMLRSPSVEW